MPSPNLTWLHVQDTNLRHSLQFGIGLHHAGLNDSDRSTVEHLFVAGKIQVRQLSSCLPPQHPGSVPPLWSI